MSRKWNRYLEVRKLIKIKLNRWPGGVTHALTMSYDDGVTFDVRLAELFDAHGIRGTFHMNSNYDMETGDGWHLPAEPIRDIARRHELSLHMHTHPFPTKIPLAQVADEVIENRRALEPLAGYPLRGMSYPYGDFNDDVIALIRALGVEYSRTTCSTGKFDIPDDFLRWNPTCHHNGVGTLWEEFIDNRYAEHKPLLFYLWGHSYEFDRDGNWDAIEQFCAKAGGRDDVWYATNIEIVDYINAMYALKFSADRALVRNVSPIDVYISVNGKPECIRANAVTRLEVD